MLANLGTAAQDLHQNLEHRLAKVFVYILDSGTVDTSKIGKIIGGNEMRIFTSLLCLVIMSACVPTTSLKVVEAPTISRRAYDGEILYTSRKSTSSVTLASKSVGEENTRDLNLLVYIENRGQKTFAVDTTNISVKVDGKPAEVYTYQALTKKLKNQENWALFATALGGAASAYSASQPTYTSGTYYGGGTYGTYSATTYNSAASQIASANAEAETSSQMASISAGTQLKMAELNNTYLKLTDLSRGQGIGGIVRFVAPRLPEANEQVIEVTIAAGKDRHLFTLRRAWD